MSRLAASPAPPAPANARAVVACQALTKVFKDFWLRDRARAVDNISFHIDRGEVFGLLGPNGSGKSTTIKMLLGLLRPTSGRLAVLGKSPTDVAAKARIGYLPEESYLYGFLDSRETLDYYGKLFQLDRRTRSRRIDELLDMVGLTHTAGRPVRDYSKGMQRRIGIAQALINDPDFLILDEPTTGLDPIGTRQVKDLILELGRRGKTILLSSHLLSDVEDVVDRMVILYGGKIRGEGTCDQLLTAAGRTTIEADELDDDTLAEIDRIIRARSEGAQAIRRVAKPRQKLEELFLDIVAKAQAERLATSGARHGGATASFLKGDGDEDASGASVIDRLVAASDLDSLPPAPVEAPRGAAAPTPPGADEARIRELLGTADPEPSDPVPANPVPTGTSQAAPLPGRDPFQPMPIDPEVDADIIGSLLDGKDDDRSQAR